MDNVDKSVNNLINKDFSCVSMSFKIRTMAGKGVLIFYYIVIQGRNYKLSVEYI